MKTWLITGVSSGFGRHMAQQLLERGETVIGTVRNQDKVQDLIKKYPDTFDCQLLDVTDMKAIKSLFSYINEKYSIIDVLINNAGYGLFGAAEELSDNEVNQIIATNLTGSIMMIRSVLPIMRKQGHGRIIQIDSYGGIVAYPGNSMYHATKFGMEGFCESLTQEVADFNIGVTLVEPGGARTEFRYGSAKVAQALPAYEGNPAHSFMTMLDPANGLAPGDPAKMAEQIIDSVEIDPAPMHMVLGSQALENTINTLKDLVADCEKQPEIAAFSDISAD